MPCLHGKGISDEVKKGCADVNIFQQVREALTMKETAEHLGFRANRSGFVYSPYQDERTPSCKLYAKSYFDFSAGRGGDLIRFTADVLGVDNWRACEYLINEFGLPFSLSGHIDRAEISRHERERRAEQAREEQFQAEWLAEVEYLKRWEELYQRALDNCILEPYSDTWTFVRKDLEITRYKLDVLCTGDREAGEKIIAGDLKSWQ